MKYSISITLLVISVFIQTAAGQQKAPEAGKQVIVVFKTHFDIGYTDWADNVRHNYANGMIEGALDLIDRSKQMPPGQQFKWIVAGWPMKEMLASSKPEVRPRIERAIRDGHFAVHSLPFTFETEACEFESMVRSLNYSSVINRKAGLPDPTDAKQTDVPSHSWLLPTLLAQAGVKFLHIGCNPASRSPEVPLLFWWEGPDRSRLMTFYFGPYYGTSPAPPENWPYKTWLAIIHTNDNTGPPTYEEFVGAIKDIEAKNPGAKVRTGSMADFYGALMAENPKLPVVRGDMPDTWIHGYMSAPREVKLSRKLPNDIFNLEKLNLLAAIWGGKPDPSIARVSEQAMESIHLFNEHTFGLAMSHGHSGYWAYDTDFEGQRAAGIYEPIEYSWEEKTKHISDANHLVSPVLSRKLKELAASVATEGDRIVVYNPLPWERSGAVTIQTPGKLKRSLRNGKTGQVVPMARDRNIIRFVAEAVPPMGYATFVPVDDDAPKGSLVSSAAGSGVIENRFFSLKLDTRTGTIVSLIDKKSRKEMAAQGGEWKFGQYVNERFSKTQTDAYVKDYVKGGWDWAPAELGRINLTGEPYRRLSGENPETEYKNDDISASALIHFRPSGALSHKYSMIIRLYHNLPFVELTWSINGKQAEPWPEGGWVSFPFNIGKPRFRLGRPGAVVDPVTDYIKGTNKDYCFVSSGASVLDAEDRGFAVMSPDVPAVSLDRPGLWKYSTDFVPQKANVFFNLYNNQWSTNFIEWVEGSWSARFYIWCTEDYSNERSLVTPAEEFRNPLMAAYVSSKGGNRPLWNDGIRLSEKGVLVTAFFENPGGQGATLRLWEQSGDDKNITITLPKGAKYKTATPVNLRGEKTGQPPLSIKDCAFTARLGAYSPASFVLE